MRKFSDHEKDVMRRLINIKPDNQNRFEGSLSSYVFTKDYELILCINEVTEQCSLYVPISTQYESLHKFLELLFLIQFLKDSRYLMHLSVRQEEKNLFFISDNFQEGSEQTKDKVISKDRSLYINTKDWSFIYNKEEKATYKAVKFSKKGNPEEYDFILSSLTGVAYPHQSLVDFVENKYKTPEEKNFWCQHHTAWFAIGISALIGLAGIWIQVLNAHN